MGAESVPVPPEGSESTGVERLPQGKLVLPPEPRFEGLPPPGFDPNLPPAGTTTPPPESHPSTEQPQTPSTERGSCNDGVDNDNDGLIDSQDSSECGFEQLPLQGLILSPLNSSVLVNKRSEGKQAMNQMKIIYRKCCSKSSIQYNDPRYGSPTGGNCRHWRFIIIFFRNDKNIIWTGRETLPLLIYDMGLNLKYSLRLYFCRYQKNMLLKVSVTSMTV